MAIPRSVTRWFGDAHVAAIVDMYESDYARRTNLDASLDLRLAPTVLRRLADTCTAPTAERIRSLLLDALWSEDEYLVLAAVRALQAVGCSVAHGSDPHRRLLDQLTSQDYAMADAAVEILLDNQLL